MADLTAKQEAFCSAYLETGNASEAYRRVYNASKMSEKTINEAASRQLKNSKVAARLVALREPVIEAAQMTLEGHLRRLKDLSELAEKEGKYSAAVTAEMARGKVSGFYTDKVEITGELSLAERMRQQRPPT